MMYCFFILIIMLTLSHNSSAQQKSKPFKTSQVSVFSNTEIEPHFKGGQSKWIQFLFKNLKIDNSCNDPEDLNALMVVQFAISKNGQVHNIEVLNSADCMKRELIKVIKLSDWKWIPGIRHGKYVNSYWKIPIRIHPEIQ